MINVHLIPEIGHLKIRSLTVRHVQSLIAKKITSGASPSTVHQIHKVLCCALKSAVKWEMVSKNVASGVSLPKIEKRETAILSEYQAQKLLDVAREHRLEGMILLGVTTGLRQGEIRALRWNHIDLSAGVLYVKRAVRYVYHNGFVEKEPKTNAGRRKILLPDVVVETLDYHREHQEIEAKQQGLAFEEWNPK